MNEIILKRLSLIYVKILLQEKKMKSLIDKELEYAEDLEITYNRLLFYRRDIVKFKNILLSNDDKVKVLQN
jgi:hypothetical protein